MSIASMLNSVVQSFPNKLHNERLMFYVSGAVFGYVLTISFPLLKVLAYLRDPNSALVGSAHYLLLSIAWTLFSLFFIKLFEVKRFGAITLIFAAFTPWLIFSWFVFNTFSLTNLPSILAWVYNTILLALSLVVIEYLIKIVLSKIPRK